MTAVTDGPNPMDKPPVSKQDEMVDLIGKYLDKKLALLGIADDPKVSCIEFVSSIVAQLSIER